jgi:hypothetical protein
LASGGPAGNGVADTGTAAARVFDGRLEAWAACLPPIENGFDARCQIPL